MKIELGQIFWLVTKSNIKHPHVVVHIQDSNVTVCSITTNLKKIGLPGNIVLDSGMGGLTKLSVVEVSKLSIVRKIDLVNYIGLLDTQVLNKILSGIEFIKKLSQQ